MDDFENKLSHVLSENNWPYDLKPEQKAVLKFIDDGEHTLAVLPTGFGKSDLFALTSKLKHKLVLVISPLNALILDQVNRWNTRGIKASCIKEDLDLLKEEIATGLDLLFISPDSLHQANTSQFIKNLQNVGCLAFDEVHCLSTWGSDFRPTYKRLLSLRAIFPEAVVLALTATATDAIVADVEDNLAVTFQTVSVVPNRPNLFLEWNTNESTENALQWYADLLVSDKLQAPKAIIYCGTLDRVSDIYRALLEMTEFTALDSIAMYHRKLPDSMREQVATNFSVKNSTIRCLISTIAFGLGVEVKNLQYVLHWGPSKSALDYWQEVGRAARDIEKGRAILYKPPYSIKHADDTMKKIINDCSESCIRKALLNAIKLKSMKKDDIDNICGGENCCSFCFHS